jgi:RNA polymerase sigma-70 factor (ECF subfamily)
MANQYEQAQAEFRQLLEAARAGSQESLDKLLESYGHHIARVARRAWHLDNPLRPLRSSTVQDSYVAAIEHFEQFKGNSEAEYLRWLAMIALRQVRYRLRREIASPEVAWYAGLTPAAHELSPAEQIAEDERCAELRSAVSRLEATTRQVLFWHFENGFTYRQIAERLGSTVAAIESRCRRALRKLAAMLSDLQP